jgi:hypothetical protein
MQTMNDTNHSRRKFIKKMAYIPPAIATLTVLPAFHANGSGWEQNDRRLGDNGVGDGLDPQPPGNPPFNDGPGTGPGMPGNRR